MMAMCSSSVVPSDTGAAPPDKTLKLSASTPAMLPRHAALGKAVPASMMAITLALFCLACGSSDPPERHGGSPEASSTAALDPAQVPESLRHLVPLARQWGIGDDLERTKQIERSSAADRDALAAALAPHHAEITAGLDSLEPGAMSDEAAAFMFMQLALEEMP